MGFDMVKYERGQVWMIRFKNREAIGHEQSKDRPWLILSIGKFNQSSKMFTAVPLTTRDKVVVSPAQVIFNNDRGMCNVILCEQVRSFDYSSGNYILDYMGTVSDEVLEKVDVAISIHLGLHYSPITLKKLYDSMEAIIKSVGHMESKVNTPVFTDNDVIDFAEKLQILASPASNEVSATRYQNPLDEMRGIPNDEDDNSGMEPISVEETKTSKDDDQNESSSKEKTPRMKWTKETCKQFIDDANNLPMKSVMTKWNISKKARFYSMKNYAQRILTEMTQSTEQQ